MGFESGGAYPESDADDEYERSVHDSSPVLATDDDSDDRSHSGSEDGDRTSNEHTPTTYGRMSVGEDRMPETSILEWNAEDVADFVGSLGLRMYADSFLENEITGDSLIALLHEDLKQMGVSSVGHRLTILKAVYEVKVKHDVPIESDHYVPLSADAEAQYATATLKDIRHLVEQLRLRDERMTIAEQELKRITEEYRRLREELLPVFKMAKESQPLPYLAPTQQSGYPQQYANYDPSTLSQSQPTPGPGQSSGGLKRQFSTKQFYLGSTPKNASPTHLQQAQERTMMEQALDPTSAAKRAVISSQHLAAMNGGQSQTSPGLSPNIPSPTSPPHTHKMMSGSTLASQSYRNEGLTTPSSMSQRTTLNGSEADLTSSYSAYPRESANKPPQQPSRRAPTPSADGRSGTLGGSTPAPGGGSVEIFKSFRVNMDDPCWKVLPAALQKYKINAPAEQYALYIVYGDQERCLERDEKPLILFKQLDKEGKKPMFMLRKTNAHPDAVGATAGAAGVGSQGVGQRAYEPPGGII